MNAVGTVERVGALPVSAPAHAPPPAPTSAGRAPARPASVVSRTLAFAAVALLAGLRFAALLQPVPVLRTAAIVAVTCAGAAALAATGRCARPWVATTLRVLVVVACAWLAGRAAGASAAEAWPWQWGGLAHTVARGLDRFDGLWPYRGAAGAARLSVLLGCAAVVLGAASVAFWPARSGAQARGAVALVLLLALYTVGAVNEPTGGWAAEGLLACAVAWLWVGAHWRPRRPARAGRATAWIALASVAGLLGAAALRSSNPVLDYRTWNPFAVASAAATFDWNQQYGPLDPQHPGEVMFGVRASAPRLWRVTTLDRFDGFGFVQSASPGATPRAVGEARGDDVSARFQIAGLRSAQLLSPGQALAVTLSGVTLPSAALFSGDGTITVAGPPPTAGDSYTVRAFVADASPAVLGAAPPGVPASLRPYTAFALPGGATVSLVSGTGTVDGGAAVRRVTASPYAGVLALARRLAAGARTSFAVVAHVERYLQRGFTYSTTPPRSAYPLVSFLLRTRIGYCQQFSGAMALLLRMDGIPARVVAGFQTGSRNGTGAYEVTGRDAHEWVEAYFNGVGWVTFDPTPASAGSAAAAPGLTGDLPASVAGPASHAAGPAGILRRRDIGLGATARPVRRGGGIAILIATGLAVGLLVFAGGLTRLRLGRDRSARGGIAEFAHALALAGVTPDPSMTLTQLERRLDVRYGPAASGYAALLRRCRYARDAPPGPSGADRRRLRRVLGAHRGPLVRLRLLLALPPGRGRADPHGPT